MRLCDPLSVKNVSSQFALTAGCVPHNQQRKFLLLAQLIIGDLSEVLRKRVRATAKKCHRSASGLRYLVVNGMSFGGRATICGWQNV